MPDIKHNFTGGKMNKDYEPREILVHFEPCNNDELACMNAINSLLGNYLSIEAKIRVLEWNLSVFKSMQLGEVK